jgi:hypothetical protein
VGIESGRTQPRMAHETEPNREPAERSAAPRGRAFLGRLSAHPVAIAGSFLAVAAAVRCHHDWLLTYDDVYITYVYAESFARGDGLRWHGSAVLGTSTPFLAVVLGGLSRLTGMSVPVLGHLLAWLAAWVGSLALFGVGRREGVPRAGLLGAWIWILSSTVGAHLGSEFLPAVAAGAAAAWAFLAGRPGRAGALLALAVAFRAESGLLAPLLAAAVVWREPWPVARRSIVRAALVALAFTALWLAVLWLLSGGEIVPQTLAAKRAQADSVFGYWPSGRGMLRPVASHIVRFFVGANSLSFFALGLLGALAWLLRRRWPPVSTALVAWGPAQVALVVLLGVAYYPWYAVPAYFAAALVLGTAAELPALVAKPLRSVAWIALAGALALAAYQARTVLDPGSRHRGDTRRFAYGQAAQLFNRYPPGTTVAAYEVGFLGYYARQPVLDLLGLVTRETPLDAVREARLDRARRALDPDLLMLPLTGGGLVVSTVGDAEEFTRAFVLDRLQLDSHPPLALYRRRSLAGRGEVRLDLAAALVASGCVPRAVDRPGFFALALLVRRGERCSAPLASEGSGRLVFGSAAAGDGQVRVVATIELAGVARPLDGDSRSGATGWSWAALALPEPATGGVLRFECAAESTDDCLVAYPHIASRADEE